MRIEVHRSVESLAEDWRALVQRTGAPPWVRPGWVSAWMSARHKGSLDVLAARNDSGLSGIAPLFQSPLKATSAPVWPCLVADRDDAVHALSEALFAHGRRRVTLQCGFPGTSQTEALTGAANRAAYRTVVIPYLRSPYVDTSRTWNDYLASRKRHRVKDVDRNKRRLAECGELEFEIRDGLDNLDGLLDEGFALEGSGWKDRRGTSVRSQTETARYYRTLASWAAQEGLLRLAFLRLGGKAIAFELLIEDDHRVYDLKGGYDEAYASYGPGIVMARECIAACFARGRSSFEFLGDIEPWKMVWADGVRTRVTLRAFAPTPAGRLDHAAFAYVRPLVRRAKALAHVARRVDHNSG